MVVKYVAEVHGGWCSFRVFTTGRPSTYLFDQLDPWGCSTGLQVPVRSADLRPEVRRALRAGRGWTTAAGAARLERQRRSSPDRHSRR
jgi:hypothetical protein